MKTLDRQSERIRERVKKEKGGSSFISSGNKEWDKATILEDEQTTKKHLERMGWNYDQIKMLMRPNPTSASAASGDATRRGRSPGAGYVSDG